MTSIIQLLRPKQWIKNVFVIAPIFFARKFENLDAWQLTITATLAFALAASAIYIINDIADREEDRTHPLKSLRPIASGRIAIHTALAVAALCAAVSVLLLAQLPSYCSFIIGLYVLLNMVYTYVLKHKALLDVFFIASCFVLRVLMGCYALSVMVSPWILLTTFTLALFLAFGKRYHELGIAGYAVEKRNLQHYSRELLDKLVVICGGAALVCYAIYTAETARAMGHVGIVYTVPFVAFGLFRYLQSIYVFGQGGEPEEVILGDRWQWLNIALWLVVTLYALG